MNRLWLRRDGAATSALAGGKTTDRRARLGHHEVLATEREPEGQA